jgi:hypothetical protein
MSLVVLVANQPVAVADDLGLRADLATKPGLVQVLAVSGNDVLVSLDGSYRLSHDGGKSWQTANLAAFCGSAHPTPA